MLQQGVTDSRAVELSPPLTQNGFNEQQAKMRRRKPLLACPPCSVKYSPEISHDIPPDNSQIDQENRETEKETKTKKSQLPNGTTSVVG